MLKNSIKSCTKKQATNPNYISNQLANLQGKLMYNPRNNALWL